MRDYIKGLYMGKEGYEDFMHDMEGWTYKLYTVLQETERDVKTIEADLRELGRELGLVR